MLCLRLSLPPQPAHTAILFSLKWEFRCSLLKTLLGKAADCKLFPSSDLDKEIKGWNINPSSVSKLHLFPSTTLASLSWWPRSRGSTSQRITGSDTLTPQDIKKRNLQTSQADSLSYTISCRVERISHLKRQFKNAGTSSGFIVIIFKSPNGVVPTAKCWYHSRLARSTKFIN